MLHTVVAITSHFIFKKNPKTCYSPILLKEEKTEGSQTLRKSAFKSDRARFELMPAYAEKFLFAYHKVTINHIKEIQGSFN